MQFAVNNNPVMLDNVAPDMTLLRYLRGEQNITSSLTGTKEGCASGDCGACTVLVGRKSAQGVVYRAVNSCILPLGSLQNQYVMTVEGLSNSMALNQLHPVQKAMVDCHGSQCGFCTPGFVMSLAGLHINGTDLHDAPYSLLRAKVLDAISGNLCRCTGYRPIVDAGIQALKIPAQTVNIVQEWQPNAPLASNPTLTNADHFYWQPESEAQLQSLLTDHPDARLIAGGTDLMLEVSQVYKILPKLIDITTIASLNTVVVDETQVTIGAATRYSELETALFELSPEFVKLLGRLGSRQIRNSGTLGGNICNASPIADCPPYLLALDAELLIGNRQGDYRREYLSDFYLDYKRTTLATGEYLAQVVIQRSALAQPLKLYKISKRYEDDISAVMGAFRCDANRLSIAFGGMAATPKRARLTEAFLHQHADELDDDLIEQACSILASEFSPLSDVRASAEYRMAMACNLLKKACYALLLGAEVGEGPFDHCLEGAHA